MQRDLPHPRKRFIPLPDRDWLFRYWPECVVTAAVIGMFADAVFTNASLFTRDISQYELPLRQW